MVAPEHEALCFHQAENSLAVMAYLPEGGVRARARMPAIHAQDGHCHGCTFLGDPCHGAISDTPDAKKGACGDRSLSRPDRPLPVLGRAIAWIKKRGKEGRPPDGRRRYTDSRELVWFWGIFQKDSRKEACQKNKSQREQKVSEMGRCQRQREGKEYLMAAAGSGMPAGLSPDHLAYHV